MITELTLSSALLIGLSGSTHCSGMCGGLGAVLGVSDQNRNIVRLLSYNAGRLLTYTTIGALAGLVGEQLMVINPNIGLFLRTIAGLLLIAMGFYISRWWQGLTKLEQIGAVCWRYIQPLTRYVLPVQTHRQALQLGVLWGLLPCGLVYSTLSWALAAAHWQQSALFMFVFGLGTLPAMLAVGVVNQQFLQRLKGKFFRTVAGLMVIAMGVITLLVPWLHASHQQHSSAVHNHEGHEGHQHHR